MELNKQSVDLIQDACNPVAVARQLTEWSAELGKTQGTDAITQSALLRAVVGKLCAMYGIAHDSYYTYEYLND